jgi:tetratricopeptide (TPR) repeat protein
MSIESLKQQARKHEQNEEWKRALEQYNKALAELARDEQVDIGLYNRVGDLYVRVGDLHAAVEHYDKAVDLYREAYLPNNAIAVCKKIIRNVPDRHRAYLVIGQIRAEQGFIPDARTNFLTYAERMAQAGDLDESFRALIEFCDLAPDDVGVRLTVVEQLLSHDRKPEAIEQLMVIHRYHSELGNESDATDVESRIFAIDPDADMSALATGSAKHEVEPGGVPGFGDITFGEVDLSGGSEAELSFAGAKEDDPGGTAGWQAGLASETTADDDSWPDEDATELPLMHGEHEAGFEEDIIGPAELPMLEVDGGEGDTTSPEAGSGGSAAMESAVEEARVGHVDEPPSDVGLPSESVRDELPAAFEEPAPRTEADAPTPPSRHDEPMVAAEAGPVIEPPPFDPSTVPEAAGPSAPASTPVGEQTPPSATEEAHVADDGGQDSTTSEPPDGGYIDLGAMILGGDEEKTTRFTVAYEEPSGDEDADFAKMLSQFKDKVSENLDSSDVRAHYDLGTAYKEMGLLDEAISSFQAALRASADHLPTYELMGQTFMEMGQPEAAVKSLERALQAAGTVEDELVGIYYYLGRAYEQLENRDSAVEYYDRVFSLDINFADVTERLRQLR